MKIKELIEKLKVLEQNSEILVSCDEELNTLFSDFEVSEFQVTEKETKKRYVIFGLSGSEIE